MGSLVQCPKCSWRGFRYYFPNHYDKAHPKDIYTEATRVDEESLDSRPIIQVVGHPHRASVGFERKTPVPQGPD